ncbi:class II glutamine amidotransferase [Neisseria brasiliensis]|uniref:class II glutamine amidotransferase n=1 Tax=Neisseria TaxID=482 RepID=UPI000C2753A9|nr:MULTISPECIES: class II glutamine amidotransferase [Neisseria]PJO78549.1 class II glutamine amidotransferase [Neisseria sp. N177_16]QGL25502.1 class II glutamine amidotransferase [Neisseria brasiliensis]
MCQLLGMNCNTPTDITFSFEGFRRRGGLTDHHADGFGIGFFEGKGIRLFHDDKPSANSPVADLVRDYPIKSENVIAHIRKASQGQTSLANTHPFVREMWGEYWLFAHNGHLIDFAPEQSNFYRAVGCTDSERAFCYILNRLRQQFSEKPDEATLFAAISELTHEIRTYGLFNFVMSNGDYLFAHASTLLHYIVRKAPFGQARLLDDDVMVDFAEVTTPNDKVAVIATLPLTRDETWHQLAVNELVMFHQGDIVHSDKPHTAIYMSVEEGLALARAVGVSC